MMPFSDIPISQGSVATCLKRGGIFFEHEFVANLQPSMLVKNFENRIIVGEVMAKSLVARFFDSRCIYLTSAYGASTLLVSRASRSAVASFSQLEADRKVLGPIGRARPGP